MELKITNIQTFSLHDGPGIRTTLFLAGCPLSCVWCHNPETQREKTILAFETGKCVLCKACEICPNGVHSVGEFHKIDREKCVLCGKCVQVCPTGALSFSNRVLTESEFKEIERRQERIVGENGGITFSGGEPLLHGESLLHFMSQTHLHKAVETCGYADGELFCRMLELCDYVMFDLKLADEELHKKYTGASNKPILKNLENLRKSGKSFVLRTPLIPGITDTEENLRAIREIVGDDPWETLEFNPLTESKYERIGKRFELDAGKI